MEFFTTGNFFLVRSKDFKQFVLTPLCKIYLIFAQTIVSFFHSIIKNKLTNNTNHQFLATFI